MTCCNVLPGFACRAAVNALFQAFPALPRGQLRDVMSALQHHVLRPAAGIPAHVQAGTFGDVALTQVGTTAVCALWVEVLKPLHPSWRLPLVIEMNGARCSPSSLIRMLHDPNAAPRCTCCYWAVHSGRTCSLSNLPPHRACVSSNLHTAKYSQSGTLARQRVNMLLSECTAVGSVSS